MCKTPASIVHLARDVCLPGRQLNGSAAHSPADVLRAIKAAKKTMQSALTQLSSDLYTQECRWLLELLQNADDNEYDRLPGTVCGVGASDGREASDLAPADISPDSCARRQRSDGWRAGAEVSSPPR